MNLIYSNVFHIISIEKRKKEKVKFNKKKKFLYKILKLPIGLEVIK